MVDTTDEVGVTVGGAGLHGYRAYPGACTCAWAGPVAVGYPETEDSPRPYNAMRGSVDPCSNSSAPPLPLASGIPYQGRSNDIEVGRTGSCDQGGTFDRAEGEA